MAVGDFVFQAADELFGRVSNAPEHMSTHRCEYRALLQYIRIGVNQHAGYVCVQSVSTLLHTYEHFYPLFTQHCTADKAPQRFVRIPALPSIA